MLVSSGTRCDDEAGAHVVLQVYAVVGCTGSTGTVAAAAGRRQLLRAAGAGTGIGMDLVRIRFRAVAVSASVTVAVVVAVANLAGARNDATSRVRGSGGVRQRVRGSGSECGGGGEQDILSSGGG